MYNFEYTALSSSLCLPPGSILRLIPTGLARVQFAKPLCAFVVPQLNSLCSLWTSSKLNCEVLSAEHGKFLLLPVSLSPFDELLGIQDRIVQQAALVLEAAANAVS